MGPVEMFETVLAAVQAGDIRGIFPAVFFPLGFALLGSLAWQAWIRTWPSVEGRLEAGGTPVYGAGQFVLSEQQYRAEVSYRYRVGSTEYQGNRLSPWVVVVSHNLRGLLERQLKGLVGRDSEVTVYYQPGRPQRAYLQRPGPVGLVVTAAAALFALMSPWLVFGG